MPPPLLPSANPLADALSDPEVAQKIEGTVQLMALGQEHFAIDPHAHAHLFGVSALSTGLGALVGYRRGGLYGSFAGSFFGGALANVVRAWYFGRMNNEGAKTEAVISGSYALLSAGVGIWVLTKRPGEKKEEDG